MEHYRYGSPNLKFSSINLSIIKLVEFFSLLDKTEKKKRFQLLFTDILMSHYKIKVFFALVIDES